MELQFFSSLQATFDKNVAEGDRIDFTFSNILCNQKAKLPIFYVASNYNSTIIRDVILNWPRFNLILI